MIKHVIYGCEKCKGAFNTETEAENCEKSHVLEADLKVAIRPTGECPYSNNFQRFPDTLIVRVNGSLEEVTYALMPYIGEKARES